jgi:oxaloacetate decarboxylase (Na+ extruding) subunit alpha
MVKNLAHAGFSTRLDMERIGQVSDYLERLAGREGFPRGEPMEYDLFHYKHQMPGGMMANWRFQLRQSGLEGRFDEILEEIARVREDLAWPIMVTPFSQIIAVQAMLNVVNGERYRVVPDEVKMYALGHFGRLLGPVNPVALDRIVSNGSQRIPIKPEALEPALPGLRKMYPNATDDERLLRYMFPADDVDKTFAAKPLKLTLPGTGPVPRLIEELARRPGIADFELERGNTRVTVSRRTPAATQT